VIGAAIPADLGSGARVATVDSGGGCLMQAAVDPLTRRRFFRVEMQLRLRAVVGTDWLEGSLDPGALTIKADHRLLGQRRNRLDVHRLL
jgi:hypothetical protein